MRPRVYKIKNRGKAFDMFRFLIAREPDHDSVNTEVGYRFIRDKILSGSYAPGPAAADERVGQGDRHQPHPGARCLRQLEADGLVTIRPPAGCDGQVDGSAKSSGTYAACRQNLETYAAG